MELWLRWYHGTCSDDKWPLVASRSKLPQAFVVAVWALLLEVASQNEDRGSIADFCPETADALFGMPEGSAQTILNALQSTSHPRIVNKRIVSWEKRQPRREREDYSTDRVRKFREKKQGEQSLAHYNFKQNPKQQTASEFASEFAAATSFLNSTHAGANLNMLAPANIYEAKLKSQDEISAKLACQAENGYVSAANINCETLGNAIETPGNAQEKIREEEIRQDKRIQEEKKDKKEDKKKEESKIKANSNSTQERKKAKKAKIAKKSVGCKSDFASSGAMGLGAEVASASVPASASSISSVPSSASALPVPALSVPALSVPALSVPSSASALPVPALPPPVGGALSVLSSSSHSSSAFSELNFANGLDAYSNVDKGFYYFMQAYPSGKRDYQRAFALWRKMQPELPEWESLVEAVNAWKNSIVWQKDSGKYTLLASNFLQRRKWLESPPRQVSTQASQANDLAVYLLNERSKHE